MTSNLECMLRGIATTQTSLSFIRVKKNYKIFDDGASWEGQQTKQPHPITPISVYTVCRNGIIIDTQPPFCHAKGSLNNNFTFYPPMHSAWPRCESSEYPDIPALSRLAKWAPQRLSYVNLFFREP